MRPPAPTCEDFRSLGLPSSGVIVSVVSDSTFRDADSQAEGDELVYQSDDHSSDLEFLVCENEPVLPEILPGQRLASTLSRVLNSVGSQLNLSALHEDVAPNGEQVVVPNLNTPSEQNRRVSLRGNKTSPGQLCSAGESAQSTSSLTKRSRRLPTHDSVTARNDKKRLTLKEFGSLLHNRRQTSSLANLIQCTLEDSDLKRSCVLDFEQLFAQYYVQVEPRRCWWSGPWQRCRLTAVMPEADAVVKEWTLQTASYIWRHRSACEERWPQLKISQGALGRQLERELSFNDQLSNPQHRVVLSLQPERVSHRLLWAIGDERPPADFLWAVQAGLQRRWPTCRIRCVDSWLLPGIFRILVLLAAIVLALCVQLLVSTAMNPPKVSNSQSVSGPSYEEWLDQLAARLLLTGGFAHLWAFYFIAATFPLRSLHSPFKRDVGCVVAYSGTALRTIRLWMPLASMAMPLAMAMRLLRLGLLRRSAQLANFHLAMLCLSSLLPFMAGAAAWSVRSSMYSHHHAFILLLCVIHMAAIIGFAAYFEVVKWAVFAVGAGVVFNFCLFAKYAAEFTSVSLLKAAKVQWAGVHVVPVLWILLGVALEVESGFARALIDFICENQDVLPPKLCRRMLRNANK